MDAGGGRGEDRNVAYSILFSPEVEGHLRALSIRDQRVVLDVIEEQLSHDPLVGTRNRKKMRPNPVALWELRAGHLRVYYDVEGREVWIRAVGVKDRDKVRIGRKDVIL